MSDFCHDYAPGGLGCLPGPCPPDCLGDFTETARERAATLPDGYEALLGICEGHGGYIVLCKRGGKVHIEEHINGKWVKKEWQPCKD